MHAHHFTGMKDVDVESRGAMLGKFGSQTRPVADQRNRNTEFTAGHNGSLHLDGRSVIATHCVDRNPHCSRYCHGSGMGYCAFLERSMTSLPLYMPQLGQAR